MKADEMQAWARHQCGEPLHELHRRHHDVGGAVAIRCSEFENYLPRAVHTKPFVGDDQARDVAAQLFKVTAPIGVAAQPFVPAESVGIGA